MSQKSVDVSPTDAVRLLSLASGQRFELVGRLAGGETGAHEVVGPDGQRLVVKWDLEPSSQVARRRAVRLSDRLREEAGWPVPRQWSIDANECLFVIQDLLPGSPITMLTHRLVDQLIDLHQRRMGLERPEDHSLWPAQLIRTLTHGGAGYCLHESLRSYDQRTARLVDRIERIGRDALPHQLRGGDVVHWDFHPGNMLHADGQISAIIDTDFMTTGDAAFDLVTLAMTSLAVACDSGVRRRLFELAVDPLEKARRGAYVGHLLIRFLDWPIRRHRPDEVELWLRHADRLLPP